MAHMLSTMCGSTGSDKFNSTSGMKDIRNGIELEDSGSFLKWGKSMKSIAKNTTCTIKNQGDRTVYFYGKQQILNGLELSLQSMFWNFGKDRWFRRLNKIEHWAIGDQEAQADYARISKHIITQFGRPQEEKVHAEEKHQVWKFHNVELSLFLFEQHCYKLHFTICRK